MSIGVYQVPIVQGSYQHLTFWELVASIHREVYTATIYIHAILHRTTKNAAYVATAKMKVASSVEENII